MAFTQANLDALTNAMASGALTVRYGDKTVTYHSLDEMVRLRNIMQAELSPNNTKRTTYASFQG